jgi:hypothetical protein
MKSCLAMALIILMATFVLVIATPSIQAQKLAGANRPAGVPEGYVITPFGYFHPSCVRGVASGDIVLADGRVEHQDGTVDKEAPVCSYPHFSASGAIVAAGVKPPSISHSWIESGNAINTTSSFGELTATWKVPPVPTANDGQTVFLFPGMEDYANTETIIQPVLGWNDGFIGTDWNIASWNCCPSGTANYSTAVPVNSGDTIYGTIKSTCKAGIKSCSKWNITTEDKTTGGSTTLSSTPSEGQTFTWAQGGALEVYSIVQCSDYPPNGSTAFSELALYDYNFKKFTSPGWVFFNYSSGLTPQCSYNGKMATTTVTLDY